MKTNHIRLRPDRRNFALDTCVVGRLSSAVALAAALQLTAFAAVPLAWTATPTSPTHMPAPVPHGSTVEFSVTLKGFTDPAIGAGADVRLWFQTNGMGSTWFSAPAAFVSNVVTATFGPEQDTGADRVNCFFGAPSNVFASAVLRLTHAPGFVPNAITPPVHTLDFSALAVKNAPYYTKAETAAKIVELAPVPGNYAVVSNAAMNAASKGSVLPARREPTSPDWNIDVHAHFNGSTSFDTSYIYFLNGFYFSGGESYRLSEDGIETPGGFAWWPMGYGRLALTNDIPPAVSNVVTKSYVEGLGIDSGIQEETDPVWSSEKSSYATKMELASAADLARARHDYRWAAKQGVLYRIDFDADGYQYLTPVTNVNALAEGNEHILIHLEEHKND